MQKPRLGAFLGIIRINNQGISCMKKTLKILLPAAAALAVMIAVPHLRHEGGCSCQAPAVVFGSLFGCGDSKQPKSVNPAGKIDEAPVPDAAPDRKIGAAEHKVTFVEIGSVNCIPCKMMQPVMKAVEDEYGARLKLCFTTSGLPREGRME